MRIYDDNDMEKPDMAWAKAGLDALVEELKTAGTSKVEECRGAVVYTVAVVGVVVVVTFVGGCLETAGRVSGVPRRVHPPSCFSCRVPWTSWSCS